MGRRRPIALAIAALLLLAVSAGAVACSSDDGNGGGDNGDTVNTTTFRNDEFGFSITYPEDYVTAEPETTAGEETTSAYEIAFADPDGTVIDELTVDGLQISIYQLNVEFTPEEVPDLVMEFQGLVDQLVGGLENGTVEEPLSETTVNGVPGFTVTYTYTNQGNELRASSSFLVKGAYEYMVTSQATTARWDQVAPEFEAATTSFAID